MNLSELVSTGDIRARRHLTLREEVSSDGKFSYYLNYDFLPKNVHTPTAVCQQANLNRKAYVVGYQNLDAKPFTDGWPYVNWWPDGVDVVMPYNESDLGAHICFEIPNHQPSGGSNYLYRSNRFYHATLPPTLSVSGPTWQSTDQVYRTTLTAGLFHDPQQNYVAGAIKIYKHSIAQVPRGTTNCNRENAEFKAIAASDADGRYTATISNSNKTVKVDFLTRAWGKTYCFAVWDNEGHRTVAGPVFIPPPQETHEVSLRGGTKQFRLKLWHNGLTFTDDGIESTGELSYTVSLEEINRSASLTDNRHLFPTEEAHSDGTFSYYVEYEYLAGNVPDAQANCRNNLLTSAGQRRAYIGQENRAERPGTGGQPYADWWTGWEVVLPYDSSDIGGWLCFAVRFYRPQTGYWSLRTDFFVHRINLPSLSASDLTYQSGSQKYRTTLTTTLPTAGTFKVWKYNIAEVPRGTTSCSGDSFQFEAIAGSDSRGRYTATITNNDKTVTVDFDQPAWGKTYCFAVWDVEGRRGVSAPVSLAAQWVRLNITGNSMGYEHRSERFSCPIPGFLGLTETTNYIMTTGGGGTSGYRDATGINTLLNRYIRERFGNFSLQVKAQNGGPFTLATPLKYIHDALSYSDAGEQPYNTFALNRYRAFVLYPRGVRDVKMTWSALGALVHDSHVTFAIELGRPATTRTTVRYITGGGTATGTNKTSFGDYFLDGSEDYVAMSGDLVFEPGQYRKFVSVPLINDCVADSDETLMLSLNDPNGSTGDAALDRWFANNASPTASYTIKNHDTVQVAGQPTSATSTTTTTVAPTTTSTSTTTTTVAPTSTTSTSTTSTTVAPTSTTSTSTTSTTVAPTTTSTSTTSTTVAPTTTSTSTTSTTLPPTTTTSSTTTTTIRSVTTTAPTTTTTVPVATTVAATTTTTTMATTTTTVAAKDRRDCSGLMQAYVDAVYASVQHGSRDAAKTAVADAAKEAWRECEAYNRSL